jgi:hypothetical protein
MRPGQRSTYPQGIDYACQEDAGKNTAWRILVDGFGPLTSPVKLTGSARYPRDDGPGKRTRHPDRVGYPRVLALRLFDPFPRFSSCRRPAAGGVPGHPGAGALRRVMTAFLWRTRQQDRRPQRISVRGDNVCCLDRSRVGATAPIMPCGKTANDSRHAIRTDYRHAVLAGGIRDFPVPERVMCKAVRCLPPPSRAGCPSPSHRPTDARVE